MTVYTLPRHIRTIIFDIDSTLYTNHAYAHEQIDCQIRRFASLRGIPYQEAKQQVRLFQDEWAASHGGAKISLGNTLATMGIPIQESIRWREELLEPARFLRHDKRLYDTLERLSEQYRLACVTNNPRIPAQKTLEALGVEVFFPEIIALDTCGVSKPHRAPFELAALKTDANPDECLSVGDRYDIDIALPLEMGMGGILVEGVEDVYQLPAILDGYKQP